MDELDELHRDASYQRPSRHRRGSWLGIAAVVVIAGALFMFASRPKHTPGVSDLVDQYRMVQQDAGGALPPLAIPRRLPDGWTFTSTGGSSAPGVASFGMDFIRYDSGSDPLSSVYVCLSTVPEACSDAGSEVADIEKFPVPGTSIEVVILGSSPGALAEWNDVAWTKDPATTDW